MPTFVQAAILGAIIGALMTWFEYSSLKKSAEEYAKRYHKKPELDQIAQNRIKTVFRFALLLPIGFAIGAWIIWGSG